MQIDFWRGGKQKDPRTFWEISNHHPRYISCKISELFQSGFHRSDAEQTIAREYGYRDWTDLQERGSIPYEQTFEQAVDRLINGQIEELSELIDETPDLVNERSNYGHGAGLIHYCVSNGVESWRQQVPLNLAEVIGYLLRNGANSDMNMYVYGGQYKPLHLLKSSVHPVDAGIAKEAISCLNHS